MKIWYDGLKYDLIKKFRPVKSDLYLLCRRKDGSVHLDGTPCVQMILLDAHNNVFMLDSAQARKIVDRKRELESSGESKRLHRTETDIWLDNVKQLDKCAK